MIIEHVTDTDLYNFSQQQAAWRQYPSAVGRYGAIIRSKNLAFPMADIADEIRDEIMSMSSLSLSNAEYGHMQTMPWYKQDYLDWLTTFRFYPDAETKLVKTRDGGIDFSVYAPLWHRGIMYEVPVLAIIEQVYCSKVKPMTDEEAVKVAIERLIPKINMLKGHPRLMFTDFGTRRRFSKAVHKAVVKYLKENCPNLVGTSNVWLSMELGLKAIGTMAHQWIMAHLALVERLELAQKRSFHVWQQEYVDDLGTLLTDTFTTAAFWRDFDIVLARASSGVRQDSGIPEDFGWNAIKHYKDMGIDPRTKNIIFSDNLTFQKMIDLFEMFIGLIGVGFGIGTNLTNDMGIDPLSIVIKLLELNGIPLVKLGDDIGTFSKALGEPGMRRRVMAAYGVPTA